MKVQHLLGILLGWVLFTGYYLDRKSTLDNHATTATQNTGKTGTLVVFSGTEFPLGRTTADEDLQIVMIDLYERVNPGYTKGLIELDDRVRFYIEDRSQRTIEGYETLYFEAEINNLHKWELKGKVNVEDYDGKDLKHGNAPVIRKLNGKIWGWQAMSGGIAILKTDDGINFKFHAQAFHGEVDGMTNISYDEKTEHFYIYSRNRSFQGVDRRGINVWSEDTIEPDFDFEQTIDPMDLFDYSGNSIYDVYDIYGIPQRDGSMKLISNVFWKERDRFVNYKNGRNTDPIYPVFLKADNQRLDNLRIEKKLPVIPLEPFERVHPNPKATGGGKKEVGQIYCNSYLELDDVELFGFMESEDTHYEPYDGFKKAFGIYIKPK